MSSRWAARLAWIQAGGMVVHPSRGETRQIGLNTIILVIAAVAA